MPNAVIPARGDTYAVDAENNVSEVIGWEIDTTPTLRVLLIVPETGFNPIYVIFPDGQRYTYPGWVYSGWGMP